MSRHRILYVDDEEPNLVNFEHTFENEYEIFTALNGEEGFEVLKKEGEMSLVISDQKMPGIMGTDFLYKVRQLYPDSVRMVITAYSDTDYLIDSINKGYVYRYVLKPWDEFELQIAIKHAVEKYGMKQKNKKLLRWLEVMNSELEQRVQERTGELKIMNDLLKKSNKELRKAHRKMQVQTAALENNNAEINNKLAELQKTKAEIQSLQELLPICSYCKKVRDDKNYWQEVENYLDSKSNLKFSHGICPDCYKKKVKPDLKKLKKKPAAKPKK